MYKHRVYLSDLSDRLKVPGPFVYRPDKPKASLSTTSYPECVTDKEVWVLPRDYNPRVFSLLVSDVTA